MNNSINPAGTTMAALPAEMAPVRPAKAPPPAAEKAAEAEKVAAETTQNAEASRRELQQAIERLNDQVKKNNYNLSFSVDEASRHVVVRIRDANSGEVVRQIPNETVLRLSENLKGLLQDEKI